MRAELVSAIRRSLPSGPVALSLSGGTDSLCLLFTLLELKVRPTCYTYRVGDILTEDLKRAMYITAHYNLPLFVASIPDDLTQLLADVRVLVQRGYRGKVGIQCMHGHMYLAKQVQERVIYNGSGVDGLYGSYKQFALDGSARDKVLFDRHRRKHLDNPNDDAMEYQTKEYGLHGVKVAFPYRDSAVVRWLMERSYIDLMKPRYKWATVGEYPEFQQHKGLYRPRGSQQIVAGTRALHEKLLTSTMNRGHARVQEVYKDVVEGVA